MKFSLTFLPATYGDAIWIEYGNAEKVHRILIDGGTKGTRNHITAVLGNEQSEMKQDIELMIVTHYDKDHIDGILGLMEMEMLPFNIQDIWFNGWQHLSITEEIEQFGAIMAEDLTDRILYHRTPWNAAFNNGPVVVPANGKLPVIILPGGMKVTVLSPYLDNLNALRTVWAAEVIKNNQIPGYGSEIIQEPETGTEMFGDELPNIEELALTDFEPDKAEGNAASIAILLEFGGKTVLLVGDAVPEVVLKSLTEILPEGKLHVDLFKLSHHGSRGNTGPDLIRKLHCNRYVISTNGAIYRHPHPETIAWVLKNGGDKPQLIFNYRSPSNEIWDSSGLKTLYQYQTSYPKSVGNRVDLF